jgi:LPXTG-motif cell wall-anchored protein
VSVIAVDPAAVPALAATGVSASPAVAAAILLVLFGAALLLAPRRARG